MLQTGQAGQTDRQTNGRPETRAAVMAWLLLVSRVGSGKFEWSRKVVTASTPLMVSEDDREAVAAVVGLQMTYSRFHEFFVNATRVCPRDFAASSDTAAAACNLTCASPVIAEFRYAIWSQTGLRLVVDLLARASSLAAS